eukprot:GHVL01032680.1.p1 GENE.GHVL01032680.1~~GHVL01032680.1.p1  ORF type:complete len:201 (+),score=32.14 GHVL01032680.1:33-635(+)
METEETIPDFTGDSAYQEAVRHTLKGVFLLLTNAVVEEEAQDGETATEGDDVQKYIWSAPEVETKNNPECILEAIHICKSAHERCLIEASVNSVRVSFKFPPVNDMEQILLRMYSKSMMKQADKLQILRRCCVNVNNVTYDICFLITAYHFKLYDSDKLVDILVQFIRQAQVEVKHQRLCINSLARSAATRFLAGCMDEP